MTTGPSQDIGNGTGHWLEGQLAVHAKPQASKSWDIEHIAAHGIANHHAQLPFGDALAVLEVRQWQALEAEAFSQRHAATT